MRSWIRKALLVALCGAPVATLYAADPPINGNGNGQAIASGGGVNGVIINDTTAPVVPAAGYTLTPEGERFSVRGWLDGGYVYNASNPASGFNGPYNSVYGADQGAFNQAYLIAEYFLPKDGSVGVGGRIDALYGSDFLVAQSLGLETNPNGTKKWNSSSYYGVALPQMYGLVGTNDANVKIGHFYSLVGYESVQSTSNFFYSKSYSYQFGGPFTHWGAIATVQLSDNWQVQGGAHMGWNTLDGTQDHVSGIAALKYTACDKAWWSSFAITSGQDPSNPSGNPLIANGFSNRTRYSWIIDANLTERIEYVFHNYLGFQENGAPNGGTALWYGVDQYAYYTINDCWKFGGRFEWFRDEDGTRVGLTLPANPNRAPLPGNYFSGTLGFNYSPIANLVIRPEARYDFATNTVAKPFNDGTNNSQFMLAVDAILKY